MAKDGALVPPASGDDAQQPLFAPLVVCEPEPAARDCSALDTDGEIRIAVGDVLLRLDAGTPARRIAGIVHALGAVS